MSSSPSSSSQSLWWERCKHRPINGKILVFMTFLSVVAMIVASYSSSSSSSSKSFSLFFPTGRGGEGDDYDAESTTTIPVAREEPEEVLREEEDAS